MKISKSSDVYFTVKGRAFRIIKSFGGFVYGHLLVQEGRTKKYIQRDSFGLKMTTAAGMTLLSEDQIRVLQYVRIVSYFVYKQK